MLYNLVMMFCFMQFIMVAVAALLCIVSIKLVNNIVRMYSIIINKVNHNNNVSNYYFKNRGVRGVVRILGGRAFSAKPVAMSTRRNRKLVTAAVRKEAWLVKHNLWLVQKNRMFARTNRVRKQEKYAAMQYVQTSNIRRKHVVASRVYTNVMPKAAKVDYLSIMRADMALRSACTLASLLLHTEDKALKGKATLNEQAQRAAMAAIWAGNVEARATFSALRTEGMQIKARRTQIWDVLNGQVSSEEVAS